MIQNFVKKVFGSRSDREVKQLLPMVAQINQLAEGMTDISDEAMIERSHALRESVIAAREAAQAKAEADISDKDEANKYVLLAEHEKLEEILQI